MENKLKVVVFSLGCKVNQYEGRSMVEKLEENGFYATDKPEPADAYIINTCSVTAEADKKSRQAVARMLKQTPMRRSISADAAVRTIRYNMRVSPIFV